MEKITFKTDNTGITIHLPKEILIFIANNHPDGIIVTDSDEFIENLAYELEHNGGAPESGYTGFQELIDDFITEIAATGLGADFKNY